MHIETFKVFCDLIETTSFSEAAERNGISQSAVSQQVRALEDRFGVTLVERGRRNFAVTPEGEVFLKAAREILEAYRSIEESRCDADIVAGRLTIATVYSIGFHELPPHIEEFRGSSWTWMCRFSIGGQTRSMRDVSDNHADLGLVAYPQEKKGGRNRASLEGPPCHHLSSRASAFGEEFDRIEGDQR